MSWSDAWIIFVSMLAANLVYDSLRPALFRLMGWRDD